MNAKDRNGPWSDGDMIVVARPLNQIDGPCIVTCDPNSDEYACTKFQFRNNLFAKSWLVFAIIAMVTHRAIAPHLFGRELSLAESNYVLLPGLLSILMLFDHVSVKFNLAASAFPAAGFVKAAIPVKHRMAAAFGLIMLPVFLVVWNLDSRWIPPVIQECLLIASTLIYALLIPMVLLHFGLIGIANVAGVRIARVSRDFVWIHGASGDFISTLPVFCATQHGSTRS